MSFAFESSDLSIVHIFDSNVLLNMYEHIGERTVPCGERAAGGGNSSSGSVIILFNSLKAYKRYFRKTQLLLPIF